MDTRARHVSTQTRTRGNVLLHSFPMTALHENNCQTNPFSSLFPFCAFLRFFAVLCYQCFLHTREFFGAIWNCLELIGAHFYFWSSATRTFFLTHSSNFQCLRKVSR